MRRSGFLAQPRHTRSGYPLHNDDRWPARTAQAVGRCRSSGHKRLSARDLLSLGRGTLLQLGYLAGCRRGARHSARGAGGRRGHSAGSGDKHKAFAAVRAQLRVLQRGPVSGGRDGGQLCQCASGRGRGRVGQALRGQQSGDCAHDDRRARVHARAARDIPVSV